MSQGPHGNKVHRLTRLGNSAIERGDFVTAIQAFRTLTEQEPESATAFHNLGVACYKEGHFDEAKAALRRAAALSPAGADPLFVLGLIGRDERDYPAALSALTRAIELSYGDARAYYNRGIVHFYLEDYENAIADLRQAIALDPDEVDPVYNLAVVYAGCARWEEAQECLTRCVARDPHRAAKYIGVLTDIGRAQVYEALYRRGHKIKNALGSLGARLRNLVRKFSGDEDRGECRQRLDRIVVDHDELFGQMATYLMTMKTDERSIEEVDINALLGVVVESFRNRVGTGIVFDTEFDRRVPPVLADQAGLAEALRNVLLNACEAMGRTGTITCTTALVAPGGGRPETISMTITDTGPGLPPTQAGSVFKVGFTTKRTGSGIGLSVAKRTVELHGGTIEFRSIEDAGTTVTIAIPRRVDTTKLRRPLPIRSSLIEDPSQLIVVEESLPAGSR